VRRGIAVVLTVVIALTALLDAQTRLGRIRRAAAVAGSVCTSADITFDGYIKAPANDAIGAYGGMSGRTVSGDDHLFIHLSKDYYEWDGSVSAATSTTVFEVTLSNAGGWGALVAGNRISIVHTTGTDAPQSTVITNITGSGPYSVTVSPALSATPTIGDWVWRADDPIEEIDVSGVTPAASVAAASRATRVAWWPDPYRGKRGTYRDNGGGNWSFQLDVSRPNNMYPTTLYWHEGQQRLHAMYYATYNTNNLPDYQWVSIALGAPSSGGGSDGTVSVSGPWRTKHQDRLGNFHYGPKRMGWLAKKPGTGQAIGGGITMSGIHGNEWGPGVWGVTFPEHDTATSPTGGADLIAGDRYNEYYYPVDSSPFDLALGGRINKDGTITGALPSFSIVMPGYTEIFEPDFDTPRQSVDPAQNGGYASWDAADSISGGIWIDGPTKDCLLLTGGLSVSADDDPNSEDASHTFYRNEHQYSIHLSGVSGTCQNGETYEGLTSGATLNTGGAVFSAALAKVQGGHTPADVQTFQVGETLRGNTSLCTGTITIAHRHNWCSHGFTRSVTGDFSTFSVPVFIIFDPARLETNKAGTTLDYTTPASSIIDLETTYGLETSTSAGTLNHIAGFFCNPTTRKLYTITLGVETAALTFETVIQRWTLSEGANCVGY
jgi:hypothetical protein